MEHDFWKNGEKLNSSNSNYSTSNKFFEVVPELKISIGNFAADPLDENRLFAHPKTILALKKTKIFWKELLEDKTFQCPNCRTWLHKNAWNYCPHCETRWNQ